MNNVHDLDCFTGETSVLMCDGHSYTLKELSNKQPSEKYAVFSCSSFGSIVPKLACNARLTRKNTPVICITIVNEYGINRIVCTPDHKFMMGNCEYKEAQHLKMDDELRSFGTHITTVVSSPQNFGVDDVYCLTVEGYENFALDNGVFVHNCAGRYRN